MVFTSQISPKLSFQLTFWTFKFIFEAAPLSIPQGPEGVASALAACKILKEMSRLETETEVARIMKEAKYEQLAVGK